MCVGTSREYSVLLPIGGAFDSTVASIVPGLETCRARGDES